jgi:hypothetical protein
MARPISVYIQVQGYPIMAVIIDSLMAVITVSVIVRITVVIMVSVMALVMASAIVAIKARAMAATTTWHTTYPTTPILELSATRPGLTSREQGRYVWWSPPADSVVPSLRSEPEKLPRLSATPSYELRTWLLSLI